MIYFIIWIALHAMALGIVLTKHGRKREGEYSFPWYAFSLFVTLWLMYMWGAFDNLFGIIP